MGWAFGALSCWWRNLRASFIAFVPYAVLVAALVIVLVRIYSLRPLHSQLSSKDSQLYSAHRAPLPASAPSKTAAGAQMITPRRVGLSMGLLQKSATKSNAMPTKAVFQHTSERTRPKPIAAAIKYARRAQK